MLKSVPTQRWGTADAEIKAPLPLVEAQGYQRFPIFAKHVVGQSIAYDAVPAYRDSPYLIAAFPAHSTSFSPNLFNRQRWNVF